MEPLFVEPLFCAHWMRIHAPFIFVFIFINSIRLLLLKKCYMFQYQITIMNHKIHTKKTLHFDGQYNLRVLFWMVSMRSKKKALCIGAAVCQIQFFNLVMNMSICMFISLVCVFRVSLAGCLFCDGISFFFSIYFRRHVLI